MWVGGTGTRRTVEHPRAGVIVLSLPQEYADEMDLLEQLAEAPAAIVARGPDWESESDNGSDSDSDSATAAVVVPVAVRQGGDARLLGFAGDSSDEDDGMESEDSGSGSSQSEESDGLATTEVGRGGLRTDGTPSAWPGVVMGSAAPAWTRAFLPLDVDAPSGGAAWPSGGVRGRRPRSRSAGGRGKPSAATGRPSRQARRSSTARAVRCTQPAPPAAGLVETGPGEPRT